MVWEVPCADGGVCSLMIMKCKRLWCTELHRAGSDSKNDSYTYKEIKSTEFKQII